MSRVIEEFDHTHSHLQGRDLQGLLEIGLRFLNPRERNVLRADLLLGGGVADTAEIADELGLTVKEVLGLRLTGRGQLLFVMRLTWPELLRLGGVRATDRTLTEDEERVEALTEGLGPDVFGQEPESILEVRQILEDERAVAEALRLAYAVCEDLVAGLAQDRDPFAKAGVEHWHRYALEHVARLTVLLMTAEGVGSAMPLREILRFLIEAQGSSYHRTNDYEVSEQYRRSLRQSAVRVELYSLQNERGALLTATTRYLSVTPLEQVRSELRQGVRKFFRTVMEFARANPDPAPAFEMCVSVGDDLSDRASTVARRCRHASRHFHRLVRAAAPLEPDARLQFHRAVVHCYGRMIRQIGRTLAFSVDAGIGLTHQPLLTVEEAWDQALRLLPACLEVADLLGARRRAALHRSVRQLERLASEGVAVRRDRKRRKELAVRLLAIAERLLFNNGTQRARTLLMLSRLLGSQRGTAYCIHELGEMAKESVTSRKPQKAPQLRVMQELARAQQYGSALFGDVQSARWSVRGADAKRAQAALETAIDLFEKEFSQSDLAAGGVSLQAPTDVCMMALADRWLLAVELESWHVAREDWSRLKAAGDRYRKHEPGFHVFQELPLLCGFSAAASGFVRACPDLLPEVLSLISDRIFDILVPEVSGPEELRVRWKECADHSSSDVTENRLSMTGLGSTRSLPRVEFRGDDGARIMQRLRVAWADSHSHQTGSPKESSRELLEALGAALRQVQKVKREDLSIDSPHRRADHAVEEIERGEAVIERLKDTVLQEICTETEKRTSEAALRLKDVQHRHRLNQELSLRCRGALACRDLQSRIRDDLDRRRKDLMQTARGEYQRVRAESKLELLELVPRSEEQHP